jgi:hypothetical protein
MKVFLVDYSRDDSGNSIFRPPVIYDLDENSLGRTLNDFLWKNRKLFNFWEPGYALDYIEMMSKKISRMNPQDKKSITEMFSKPVADISPALIGGELSYINQRVLDRLGEFLLKSGDIRQIINYPNIYLFNLYAETTELNLNYSIYRQITSVPDLFYFNNFTDGHPDLFLLPNGQKTVFCTERFKDAYEENEFTGLTFRLVYDSENVDFVDERYSNRPQVWIDLKAKIRIKRRIT